MVGWRSAAGIARGAEIQVGLQLIVHPHLHRLAKTADHDADRGDHGDGRGQRAHQHGGAAKRCGKAARRQQRLDSQHSAQETRRNLR